MDALERLNQTPLPFAKLLGIRFTAAAPERVTAEMTVREDLCTRPNILHGGAVMAFADTLGAAATVLNIAEGHGTTTIESKTNFLSPAPVGKTVSGECTPVHRGRRTQVWQTRISCDGRVVGIVTQTQMVLIPEKPADAIDLAALLKGKTPQQQDALLSAIERDCHSARERLAASGD